MNTKILVVDHSALVARTVAALAVRFGYHVTGCVASGTGAIASALRETPDVAFVDLHMGGDITGVESAEQLLATGIKVVFLSAMPGERADALVSLVGAHGLIAKPFGTLEFRETVESVLAPPAPTGHIGLLPQSAS